MNAAHQIADAIGCSIELAQECLDKRDGDVSRAIAFAKLKSNKLVLEITPMAVARVCSNPLHRERHPTGGCLICVNAASRRKRFDE
jgi:hypothetical protein